MSYDKFFFKKKILKNDAFLISDYQFFNLHTPAGAATISFFRNRKKKLLNVKAVVKIFVLMV